MKPIEPVLAEKVTEPVKSESLDISRPVTILSEHDAYISERMKAQPQTLTDIEVTTKEEKFGIHRLSLPEYFEHLSYDCTIGVSCKFHGWICKKVVYNLDKEMDKWEQAKHGKYIFRWLNKNKRALDLSINIKGWYLVNRTFFKEAPKILFSVNGGVELGDSILGFMPVKKALYLRTQPSKDSLDRVRSEAKKHEGHPNFYKPTLSPEITEGDDFQPAGAVQEGRDF